jgi:hypothetical protein
MKKGAKTAAGIAVVVGLGVAGWLVYKHFSKGAPATGPSATNASKPAATNASGPADIGIAGIQVLPATVTAIGNLFQPSGG